MQKLAIFGGTFNPVHWGHLLMAEIAIDQFALDQVIWVPTYHPAYKPASDLLSFQHRTEMVRRAVVSHPQFSLSTIEQNQSSPSYAIDTLTNLQKIHPNSEWFWIIGFDAFRSLPHWHRRQELVSQCRWLVAPRRKSGDCRGGTAREIALKLDWQLLDMPQIEISSSLIRERCCDRRSIRYFVPESVRHYILQQNLYQTRQSS